MRRCRFPFAGDLNSTSGPDVLVAAISEALRGDDRFADLNAQPWGADDVAWFPVGHHLIAQFMREGRPFAIGPNVAFQNSQMPGCDVAERQLLLCQNFAAIFTLSRWYSALQQKHFAQKSKHFILDYPLPREWIDDGWGGDRLHDAMIFLKGGQCERAIGAELSTHFASGRSIRYGEYNRHDLFTAARTSRTCFYISREDHYPLAAVEIALMGCPIISDEKSCPVLQHGVNGICAPVRERGESDPFAWTPDAAERLAVEWKAAAAMDRCAIREATIRKHSPSLMRERVAAQLGLG
jgi:hypothetical protein